MNCCFYCVLDLSADAFGNASLISNNRWQHGKTGGSVARFDTIVLVLHYLCSTV